MTASIHTGRPRHRFTVDEDYRTTDTARDDEPLAAVGLPNLTVRTSDIF